MPSVLRAPGEEQDSARSLSPGLSCLGVTVASPRALPTEGPTRAGRSAPGTLRGQEARTRARLQNEPRAGVPGRVPRSWKGATPCHHKGPLTWCWATAPGHCPLRSSDRASKVPPTHAHPQIHRQARALKGNQPGRAPVTPRHSCGSSEAPGRPLPGAQWTCAGLSF